MNGSKICREARRLLAECTGDATAFFKASMSRRYSAPGNEEVTTEVVALIYDVWCKRLSSYATKIDEVESRKRNLKRIGDEVFRRQHQLEVDVAIDSPQAWVATREDWRLAEEKVDAAKADVSFLCGEVNLYMSRKRRSLPCLCKKRGCACTEWLLDKLIIEGVTLWRATYFSRCRYVQYMRAFKLK